MFGINNYRNRKKLEIDIEMQEYRTELLKGVEELAFLCAKQIGEYEHDFHNKREELNTEIVKIEATRETMTKDLDNLKVIIKEKDQEIKRLTDICLEFAKTKISIQK